MPRTYGKKKQTRLSFAPIGSSPIQQNEPASDGERDRRATLRYSHPSKPTILSSRPRQDTASPSPFDSNKTPDRAVTPEQDSESDIDMTRSARKRSAPTSLKRKRSEEASESEPSLQVISDDSDGDEIVNRPRRKLRRGTVSQPVEEIEDDDDDDLPTAPRTPRRTRDQDDLDIEEDLQALQDSVVKETRTRGRLANSARAQRQQHLEALRRRRAGKPESEEEDSQLEAGESGDEGEGEGEGEENESAAESEQAAAAIKPRSLSRNDDSDVESSIAGNDDLDRYEDDFVLQDEDDLLGAPGGLDEMPFEFTRHAYKQLKDYFQDAVEWMVHNKLNPAFPRSSPVYELAFSKLEDEVKGRTGSQLVSSVWTAEFRRALLARPHMEVTSYPTFDNHPCDACKRSGHPASFDIKLYGKAYALDTLEPLEDENSDDDDDDEEEQSDNEQRDSRERDRDGHVLPDENTRFYLGRHCKTKANLAHTLTHWRFRLNEWVTDHLRLKGYLSDARILERSHWSHRKQTKYAIKAVETMVQEGEVKKLWRDFHIDLRTARESSVCPTKTTLEY
ncbi:uncharacterized protein BO95DRAFT_357318 [Aspergillus brunneoviolaceus CBS 621.78]|uniref:Uncharacterized protein n=1 Tax=Aspergillus brunneoviolaceus CBS 621.78 TaxID=1450534 RepID=A0ACD1GG66_9EURO|nr:hypothetical protein BO95DRAFT_357318 [Aspergillus brunneoviolaceus CBS 621.78]RAH48279.1 hypothetical protein BO95DRAFT_357318 [Aspergillus brunneoviolaceus CBS 621.78]